MLSNFILVLGMQVFIGNTGVLSFGHMAFAPIAGYTVAILTIPASRKIGTEFVPGFIADAPFGLADTELGPLAATLVALVVVLAIGFFVGLAVTRAGGIAATMITLAFLFVVHEVALNWTDMTNGGGGLSFIDRIDFHAGCFPDTATGLGDKRFAFVHVDADIYCSVHDACEFFYPRLVPGGVIVFDDYGFPSCPGARAAVDEFFDGRPEQPLYLGTGQALVVRLP